MLLRAGLICRACANRVARYARELAPGVTMGITAEHKKRPYCAPLKGDFLMSVSAEALLWRRQHDRPEAIPAALIQAQAKRRCRQRLLFIGLLLDQHTGSMRITLKVGM